MQMGEHEHHRIILFVRGEIHGENTEGGREAVTVMSEGDPGLSLDSSEEGGLTPSRDKNGEEINLTTRSIARFMFYDRGFLTR